jgi:hypothetical protein
MFFYPQMQKVWNLHKGFKKFFKMKYDQQRNAHKNRVNKPLTNDLCGLNKAMMIYLVDVDNNIH